VATSSRENCPCPESSERTRFLQLAVLSLGNPVGLPSLTGWVEVDPRHAPGSAAARRGVRLDRFLTVDHLGIGLAVPFRGEPEPSRRPILDSLTIEADSLALTDHRSVM
jgi:hypothetical protein